MELDKNNVYALYCSIIQSSGMGKSRLLDQLSKTYFMIPINLRNASADGLSYCDFFQGLLNPVL